MALREEILKAKSDGSALIEMIERFAPLLKSYAYFLQYEDAYADLQLKFIELVLYFNPDKMRSSDDPSILSYFRRSIHNQYIFLSKQKIRNQVVVPISAMLKLDDDDYDSEIFDKLRPPEFEDHQYEQFDLLYRNLTKYEADVIIMRFYYRCTVREIADHYGVSSSAISQVKAKAIQKLQAAIRKIQ